MEINEEYADTVIIKDNIVGAEAPGIILYIIYMSYRNFSFKLLSK